MSENPTKNTIPSSSRRIGFLETEWGLGGSCVFSARLANYLVRMRGHAIRGFSIRPLDSIGFLGGLVKFPIHLPPQASFRRRNILREMHAIIRQHPPDCLIFTVNNRNCDIARHLPKHIIKIGVIHGVDEPLIVLAGAYSSSFDALVSVSRMGLEMLQNLPVQPACACHFIPPGIMMPDEPLNRNHNVERPLRLLYLGRLTEISKRARSIVSIAALLKNRGIPFIWSVAGDGPEAKFIEQSMRDLQIDEVRLLGTLPNQDTPALFASHDVIVSTSDKEAFPLALQEAMAYGMVPVAGSAPGRVAEVVTLANGFLAHPDNPSQFADAIEKLHHDRNLLSRLSGQASEAIGNELAWPRIACRWSSLLESLTQNCPPPTDWPTKPQILPNIHRMLPRPLTFVQDCAESALSMIESCNRRRALHLKTISQKIMRCISKRALL